MGREDEIRLRVILQQAPFHVGARESSLSKCPRRRTHRPRHSDGSSPGMSPSPRLSSMLSRAEGHSGLPSSTCTGKETSMRAIASEERRFTLRGETNAQSQGETPARQWRSSPNCHSRRVRGTVLKSGTRCCCSSAAHLRPVLPRSEGLTALACLALMIRPQLSAAAALSFLFFSLSFLFRHCN